MNRLDKVTRRISLGFLLVLGATFFIFSGYPSANPVNKPLGQTILTVGAQTVQENYSTFLPYDKFSIPNLNATINFLSGGSYENAALENNTWHFKSLALNSYLLNLSERGAPPGGIVTGRDVLPYLNDNGAFSVSAKNCNITITAFEPLSTYYPYSGWLNYTVTGTGEQTFDLHFPSKSFYWNIIIDSENDQNATYESSGYLITVAGAKTDVAIHYDTVGTNRDLHDKTIDFPWLLTLIVVIVVIVIAFFGILIKKRVYK